MRTPPQRSPGVRRANRHPDAQGQSLPAPRSLDQMEGPSVTDTREARAAHQDEIARPQDPTLEDVSWITGLATTTIRRYHLPSLWGVIPIEPGT